MDGVYILYYKQNRRTTSNKYIEMSMYQNRRNNNGFAMIVTICRLFYFLFTTYVYIYISHVILIVISWYIGIYN